MFVSICSFICLFWRRGDEGGVGGETSTAAGKLKARSLINNNQKKEKKKHTHRDERIVHAWTSEHIGSTPWQHAPTASRTFETRLAPTINAFKYVLLCQRRVGPKIYSQKLPSLNTEDVRANPLLIRPPQPPPFMFLWLYCHQFFYWTRNTDMFRAHKTRKCPPCKTRVKRFDLFTGTFCPN